MFGTPYPTLLFHRPLLPASNWNFLLDWCSHCKSVVQSGGGHLSEHVPCLDAPINTFFVICVFIHCWLFFICRLFVYFALLVLSTIFDLIWYSLWSKQLLTKAAIQSFLNVIRKKLIFCDKWRTFTAHLLLQWVCRMVAANSSISSPFINSTFCSCVCNVRLISVSTNGDSPDDRPACLDASPLERFDCLPAAAVTGRAAAVSGRGCRGGVGCGQPLTGRGWETDR